jgi:hypothetical protein
MPQVTAEINALLVAADVAASKAALATLGGATVDDIPDLSAATLPSGSPNSGGDPASGTLVPTGVNNDILITASEGGEAGNLKSVAVVVDNVTDLVGLTVAAAGNAITVTTGVSHVVVLTLNFGQGLETVALKQVSEVGNVITWSEGIYNLVFFRSAPGSTNGSWQYAKTGFTGSFVGTAVLDGAFVISSLSASGGAVAPSFGSTYYTTSPALASEVITAINAASLGVVASNAPANNGTGPVAAVGPVALVGGTDGAAVLGSHVGQLLKSGSEWYLWDGALWKQLALV